MGQYRLSIYFKTQIGFNVYMDKYQIILYIPFATIFIGLTKDAHGTNFL